MSTAEWSMWAAVASAVAAITTVFLAAATIILSPLGRRLWKVLHEKYPKCFTIRVIALTSKMEDVEESHNVWQHRSTMTLNLIPLGDVFLVADNPRAILAITQIFEDHNWEVEMTGLRARFVKVNPETTHEDLVHLKRIAQRAREELERAKPGSAVWEALRFILSPPIKPIKGTEIVGKEPTWESKPHE
jgi:hypothetical protein